MKHLVLSDNRIAAIIPLSLEKAKTAVQRYILGWDGNEPFQCSGEEYAAQIEQSDYLTLGLLEHNYLSDYNDFVSHSGQNRYIEIIDFPIEICYLTKWTKYMIPEPRL